MDITDSVLLGLQVALSPDNLIYCFIGVFLGTILGIIPGIGVMTAISLLFPVTFYLDATSALIMLAGIWYGTTYGGNIAAILLNIPGTPANAVTCLDGYPMALSGRGGLALLFAAGSSFFGSTIGIIILMLFAPTLAKYALSFGSAEYFSLMLLGLIAASTIAAGSVVKSISMICFGVLLGLIGADIYTGELRYTFGRIELSDSVSIIALAMGIFGVSEIIVSSQQKDISAKVDYKTVSFSSMKPTRNELKKSAAPAFRGSAIGSFFGALPGTGPAIASFMAYAVEKRVSKTPEDFGKGAIEGLVAAESSNNSADQTAFIPTLSLGIPGSPTMALMLGALMVHGIAPGPNLVTSQPALFWGLIMSFWIGNVLLVILNVPLIGIWVRIISIPYHYLYPAIIVFMCIGVYAVGQSSFEVILILIFGVIGYLMRLLWFPAAPLLLGFVLGPLLEEHFRRAMLISRGDFFVFIERPISGTVMGLIALLIAWSIISFFRRRSV